MTKKRKGRASQETFDDFLANQGMLEACADHAIKDIIAEQLTAAMEEQGITKVAMAARMKTAAASSTGFLTLLSLPSRSTPCAVLQARLAAPCASN